MSPIKYNTIEEVMETDFFKALNVEEQEVVKKYPPTQYYLYKDKVCKIVSYNSTCIAINYINSYERANRNSKELIDPKGLKVIENPFISFINAIKLTPTPTYPEYGYTEEGKLVPANNDLMIHPACTIQEHKAFFCN